MEITPEQFREWMEVLGKPTLGLVVVFFLVYYRDLVTHLGKAIIDIIFRRK